MPSGRWFLGRTEIPAVAGCYALMASRKAALAEVVKVFALIAEEFIQKGQRLSTEIINA